DGADPLARRRTVFQATPGGTVMFEPVFESLKKATDATIQAQQEMFRKWVTLWPGLPLTPPPWGEQVQQFQKKWTEFVNEVVKRQCEALEAQFKTGLKNLEDAFRLAEVKSPEELRAKTLELWHK